MKDWGDPWGSMSGQESSHHWLPLLTDCWFRLLPTTEPLVPWVPSHHF